MVCVFSPQNVVGHDIMTVDDTIKIIKSPEEISGGFDHSSVNIWSLETSEGLRDL